MTGCTTCGGFGMHHDPIAHNDPQQVEWKAHAIASLREGRCPHSGRPMFRDGIVRPACAVCDCFGFDDEVTSDESYPRSFGPTQSAPRTPSTGPISP